MSKPTFTLGDAPVAQEYADKMTAVARSIDQFFNGAEGGKTVGFVLMVFPFGNGGRCNYMSNANRDDIVATLKEQIRRFEGYPDTKETRA